MTDRSDNNLLDPALHRDSCGFGLIANLDDLPSHGVVETAIEALAQQRPQALGEHHRGVPEAAILLLQVAEALEEQPRDISRTMDKLDYFEDTFNFSSDEL